MRRGYADWAHGQIHYRSAGEGDAVVLMGGAPRSGGQFDPIVEVLAARGFRAIAPDMPGFGQSDRVPEGTGMAGIAAFLPALLDTLGIGRAHLFGLHSGGKVAAAAAVGSPDRVASLIVAGKSHSIVANQTRRNETVKAEVVTRYFADGADCVEGPDALRGWAAEARYLNAMWWSDTLLASGDPEPVMRAIEARMIDHLAARRTVRNFYAANSEYDLTGDLHRADAPLLILEITSPTEDAQIGRQAAGLIAGISGARTAELPQVDGPGYVFHTGIAPLVTVIADFASAHPIPA